MATWLIVPGLGDSGATHWQTWLERQLPDVVRVRQDEWAVPDLGRWSARVREVVERLDGPVWLVAHSFGCLASVEAAAACPERIAGALLVAPADPERVGAAVSLSASPLPFPSRLLASTTDPWLALDTARQWARRWGSRFINLGAVGHINVDSGHGPWPEGLNQLRGLQSQGVPEGYFASGTPAFGPRSGKGIGGSGPFIRVRTAAPEPRTAPEDPVAIPAHSEVR